LPFIVVADEVALAAPKTFINPMLPVAIAVAFAVPPSNAVEVAPAVHMVAVYLLDFFGVEMVP
jgi:hypothetical protein